MIKIASIVNESATKYITGTNAINRLKICCWQQRARSSRARGTTQTVEIQDVFFLAVFDDFWQRDFR
jgi:agmatine/peptidylarginine deiminase